MSIKETQRPAKEFRPLFDRAMKLIQQRYPDWIEASRLDRKEITISECLDMLICFASDELDAYKANKGLEEFVARLSSCRTGSKQKEEKG